MRGISVEERPELLARDSSPEISRIVVAGNSNRRVSTVLHVSGMPKRAVVKRASLS